MSRIDAFAAVIAAWNAGDVERALAGMTDDVVWHVAVGAFAPLVGKGCGTPFLNGLRGDMATTNWCILHHAEQGDRLFVEGVDAYTLTTGVSVAMPYAAVVEFAGDRIARWRDYIDTRRMESLRSGKPAPDHIGDLIGGSPLEARAALA